jgi:hypothetical protein
LACRVRAIGLLATAFLIGRNPMPNVGAFSCVEIRTSRELEFAKMNGVAFHPEELLCFEDSWMHHSQLIF